MAWHLERLKGSQTILLFLFCFETGFLFCYGVQDDLGVLILLGITGMSCHAQQQLWFKPQLEVMNRSKPGLIPHRVTVSRVAGIMEKGKA